MSYTCIVLVQSQKEQVRQAAKHVKTHAIARIRYKMNKNNNFMRPIHTSVFPSQKIFHARNRDSILSWSRKTTTYTFRHRDGSREPSAYYYPVLLIANETGCGAGHHREITRVCRIYMYTRECKLALTPLATFCVSACGQESEGMMPRHTAVAIVGCYGLASRRR